MGLGMNFLLEIPDKKSHLADTLILALLVH